MSEKGRIIIDLHAPASPYIVIEFVKTITYHVNKNMITPVITRPTGLAAQSGIPEAWRHAYKNETPLAVLPELKDVLDLYRPEEIFITLKTQESLDIDELNNYIGRKNILIIIPSGEQSLTKEEQNIGRKIYSRKFIRDMNPLTILGIILEKI
ncbi:MAG: RecB-family nuclease [Desulfurococcales archaeon]|jgi:SpoU rRNA methylase family enzyme|nr:RecB-family nuclease [Desulfurococcales archaeon]